MPPKGAPVTDDVNNTTAVDRGPFQSSVPNYFHNRYLYKTVWGPRAGIIWFLLVIAVPETYKRIIIGLSFFHSFILSFFHTSMLVIFFIQLITRMRNIVLLVIVVPKTYNRIINSLNFHSFILSFFHSFILSF